MKSAIAKPRGVVGMMTVSKLSNIECGSTDTSLEMITFHETVPRRAVVSDRFTTLAILDVDSYKVIKKLEFVSFSFMKWDEERILVFSKESSFSFLNVVTGDILNSCTVLEDNETYRGLKLSEENFILLRFSHTGVYNLNRTSFEITLIRKTEKVVGDTATFFSASKVFQNCLYVSFSTYGGQGNAQLLNYEDLKVKKSLESSGAYTIDCTKNNRGEEIVLLGNYSYLRIFNCGSTLKEKKTLLVAEVTCRKGWGAGCIFSGQSCHVYVGYATDGKFVAFDFSTFMLSTDSKKYSLEETENQKAGGYYRGKESFHSNDVLDMCVITWNGKVRKGESGVEMISCGHYGSVVHVSVGGLPFANDERDKLSRLDLIERIMFLREKQEIYEGDKFGIFIDLKLKNIEIESVFRVFCKI